MEAAMALFIWYSQHTQGPLICLSNSPFSSPGLSKELLVIIYTHYHSTLVYSPGSYKCTQSLLLLHDLHNKLENTSKLCVIVFSGYSLLYSLAFLNLDILFSMISVLLCDGFYSALQETVFKMQYIRWVISALQLMCTLSVFNCNSAVDLPEHSRFIRVEI